MASVFLYSYIRSRISLHKCTGSDYISVPATPGNSLNGTIYGYIARIYLYIVGNSGTITRTYNIIHYICHKMTWPKDEKILYLSPADYYSDRFDSIESYNMINCCSALSASTYFKRLFYRILRHTNFHFHKCMCPYYKTIRCSVHNIIYTIYIIHIYIFLFVTLTWLSRILNTCWKWIRYKSIPNVIK